MKRFLLAALPLLFSFPALAQPDPDAQGMGRDRPVAVPLGLTLDTPESATRFFLEALRTDNEYNLRIAVSGVRPGIYGSPEWHKLRMRNYASEIGPLKIEDVEVTDHTENEAQVTVTARRNYQNNQAVEGTTPVKYQLSLRRETNLPHPGFGPDQKSWRVVPLTTDEVLGKPLSDLPPLQLAATLVLQDPRLLPVWYKQEGERLYQKEGVSRLKQLGLGAMQFALDYDEVFALDDAACERALFPYTKSDMLFPIPGTKEEKWHFNDNLSQKDLAAVAEPARTVLFYDGDAPQTDKLNFRFLDKTLICFADGHVKALSKDELKDIIWEP